MYLLVGTVSQVSDEVHGPLVYFSLFFTVYPISSVTAIEKQPYIQNQQIYIDTICPCIYGKNHNGGSGRNKKNLEK